MPTSKVGRRGPNRITSAATPAHRPPNQVPSQHYRLPARRQVDEHNKRRPDGAPDGPRVDSGRLERWEVWDRVRDAGRLVVEVKMQSEMEFSHAIEACVRVVHLFYTTAVFSLEIEISGSLLATERWKVLEHTEGHWVLRWPSRCTRYTPTVNKK